MKLKMPSLIILIVSFAFLIGFHTYHYGKDSGRKEGVLAVRYFVDNYVECLGGTPHISDINMFINLSEKGVLMNSCGKFEEFKKEMVEMSNNLEIRLAEISRKVRGK